MCNAYYLTVHERVLNLIFSRNLAILMQAASRKSGCTHIMQINHSDKFLHLDGEFKDDYV